MRRSRLLLAWFLLLVPTLLLGWGALRLVSQEGERLAAAARGAAGDRATALAESVALAVGEVRSGVLETLSGLPIDDLVGRLDRWRASNPLIRNVFVWDPSRGLVFPDGRGNLGPEETGFVARYGALFDGRAAWAPQAPEGEHASRLGSLPRGRRSLAALASAPAADRASPTGAESARTLSRPTGWRPWFWEDRVHLLGWARIPATGVRFGVEVEVLAMLARLAPDFPVPEEEEGAFALVDGNGRVFHQTGVAAPGANPLATVPVGPELPHWQVSVFGPPTAGAQGGFLLVASLLVGTFVVAILLGGGLLVGQARRSVLDARRKTSFVSNVSHELKTPLTTIRMYAELLEEGRVAGDEKRLHYLSTIAAESRRLTRLVNNVLDFSRLEQGCKRYVPEGLDLSAVARGVLHTLTPRFRETGVTLDDRLPDAGPVVKADRDALEQIVLNLVDNALKYAAQGGEVALEAEGGPGGASLRVLDRGPGIPAGHRERVFEQFHRVDDSLTTSQPGSGLGLAIARQMARDLGGDLVYGSRTGGGACFELTLLGVEGAQPCNPARSS